MSLPNRDKLTMRFKPLKRLDLILGPSKDEDTFSGFFSRLLAALALSRFIAMPELAAGLEGKGPRYSLADQLVSSGTGGSQRTQSRA